MPNMQPANTVKIDSYSTSKMSFIFRMYFYSLLLSLAFIGAGLSIEFMRMDNASKDFLQSIYFIILFFIILLGNIALVTRNAGESKKRVNLFDYSVAVLGVTAGLFCLLWFRAAHFSWFTVVCIVILVTGALRAVRLVF